MSNLIAFLEAAGRGQAAASDGCLPDGLSPDMLDALVARDAIALARAVGVLRIQACYISAPDNEPVPEDSPEEMPEDPDRQDSEAA